jgi:hypothetical protein
MARPYSTLVHIFAAGSIAIVSQMALGALLIALAPSPEWVIAAVVFSFLLGVPLGIAITRALPALTFPAMGLLALTGIAPAFVIDAPLWGRTADLSAVGSAQAGANIAGFVASGWRIDESAALEERVSYGRGNKSRGSRRMAPLVGADWTPDRPVDIWVAGEIRDSGRILPSHPKFWPEPNGEFVRLVGKDVSGAQLAAGRAAQKFSLQIPEEPVIVMRVPSVSGALASQHWALLRAARFPFTAWLILVGIAAAIIGWRERSVRATV